MSKIEKGSNQSCLPCGHGETSGRKGSWKKVGRRRLNPGINASRAGHLRCEIILQLFVPFFHHGLNKFHRQKTKPSLIPGTEMTFFRQPRQKATQT